MNLVNVSDNYFTERQHQFILTYCENCKYTYGEVDNTDTPPTGLIHNIPYTEEIYRLIEDRIVDIIQNQIQCERYLMEVRTL